MSFFVSVVIPSHNEGEYITKTVNSVNSNTAGKFEIIVVDDASSDGSVANLNNARIVKHAQREGLSKTRNDGARVAKGDIVVFIDAHTEVEKGWMEAVTYSMNKNRNALVTGAIGAIFANGTKGAVAYGAEADSKLGLKWRVDNKNAEDWEVPCAGGGFQAMDRIAFGKSGGFDEGLKIYGFDDVEMSIRWWGLGGQVVVNPNSKIWHYFSSTEAPINRANTGTMDQFVYNGVRTATMHFDDPRLSQIKQAQKADPQHAAALSSDQAFQSRLQRYRAVRVMSGEQLWDKFQLQIDAMLAMV